MQHRSGFTLVELSLVLVIVGLITGGVLVGRDLIEAARIRQQITQIEQFKAAVNTFRTKYNGLPGDLNSTDAIAFGFMTRSGQPGHGDGDGMIEYCDSPAFANPNLGCENVLFWSDLSAAGLIEGSFTMATDGPVTVTAGQANNLYIPDAKLGAHTSVVVFSQSTPYWGGADWDPVPDTPTCGVGSVCYAILGLSNISNGSYIPWPNGQYSNGSGLTPMEAFAIDSKIDDGLPATGNVTGGSATGNVCTEAGCSNFLITASFTGITPSSCIIISEPSPGQFQGVYSASVGTNLLGYFNPLQDVPNCMLNISGQ